MATSRWVPIAALVAIGGATVLRGSLLIGVEVFALCVAATGLATAMWSWHRSTAALINAFNLTNRCGRCRVFNSGDAPMCWSCGGPLGADAGSISSVSGRLHQATRALRTWARGALTFDIARLVLAFQRRRLKPVRVYTRWPPERPARSEDELGMRVRAALGAAIIAGGLVTVLIVIYDLVTYGTPLPPALRP